MELTQHAIDPAAIDEAYVRQAARLAGIALAPEHVPGVVYYLRMVATFAAEVQACELTGHTESAALYLP